AASGKVLQSDSDDHVFVYFADHGATDLIAFPEGELYNTDLLEALQTMYQNKMYAKLLFYLEACESGSMFLKLPADIDIYATTAANPDESSYGFYCNVTGMPCLGDEYSIHWMEDSDAEDITTETLDQQFQRVKKETLESHVSEYGDMDFQTEALVDFQGGHPTEHIQKEPKGPRSHDSFSVIPSREIQMTKLQMALREK
uniref:C13 family peptidase n=1 Tax=Salmonella sp. S146_54837 TaxID=2665635 RepID=UPI00165978D2